MGTEFKLWYFVEAKLKVEVTVKYTWSHTSGGSKSTTTSVACNCDYDPPTTPGGCNECVFYIEMQKTVMRVPVHLGEMQPRGSHYE